MDLASQQFQATLLHFMSFFKGNAVLKKLLQSGIQGSFFNLNTVKFLNFRTPTNFTVRTLKFKRLKRFYLGVFLLNDANVQME